MSRILLVDDDEQVNEVLKASIEILGHAVKTVDCGDKALEVLSEFRPDFTLVDMMMPGKSGAEVIQDIHRLNPAMITCLTTGLADPNLLEQVLNDGAWSLLSKPYSLADLAELIRMAELLSTALRMETELDIGQKSLLLTHPGNVPVNSEDIARLVNFAQACGSDLDVAHHCLPVIAYELMKNAQIHGTSRSSKLSYGAELMDAVDSLELKVFDSGSGFDWQKTLVKTRMRTDKARASGLQVVTILADEFSFDARGRTAFVRFNKPAPHAARNAS
jgi:CheY-like chemotaxis protein